MSPASQEELEMLLAQVLALPEIEDLAGEGRLDRIRFQLIDAGERINVTCAQLVEQLRKYLDDQTWLENKRIMEIIRRIEKKAIRISSNPPPSTDYTHVDHVKPKIGLPMARGLFRPPPRIILETHVESGEGDFQADALYQQHYVNEKTIRKRIHKSLKGRTQVSLAQICEAYPVDKGLSEILAYLHIACKIDNALVDSDTTVPIYYEDGGGHRCKVMMPEVIFVR
jgi:hypothetical protein